MCQVSLFINFVIAQCFGHLVFRKETIGSRRQLSNRQANNCLVHFYKRCVSTGRCKHLLHFLPRSMKTIQVYDIEPTQLFMQCIYGSGFLISSLIHYNGVFTSLTLAAGRTVPYVLMPQAAMFSIFLTLLIDPRCQCDSLSNCLNDQASISLVHFYKRCVSHRFAKKGSLFLAGHKKASNPSMQKCFRTARVIA